VSEGGGTIPLPSLRQCSRTRDFIDVFRGRFAGLTPSSLLRRQLRAVRTEPETHRLARHGLFAAAGAPAPGRLRVRDVADAYGATAETAGPCWIQLGENLRPAADGTRRHAEPVANRLGQLVLHLRPQREAVRMPLLAASRGLLRR